MKISVFNSAGRSFIINSLLAVVATTIMDAADQRGLAKVRAPRQDPPRVSSDAGPTRLEMCEELSESLANDLLEFSAAARERDVSRL
ncbi:MAG TPA: hypothetical protein VM870_10975, partial [Pyrinomonadaceae bacterium]|nr:hypothetical protein [Pyrinomonadaceae bacterium]